MALSLKDMAKTPKKTQALAQKKKPAKTARPTLDVADLINRGVFEKAEPSPAPKRSTAERFVRAVRTPLQSIGRAATLGLGGSGGLIERKLSGVMGKDVNPALAPETRLEKGLSIGGEIAGSAAPIGGLYKLARPAVAKAITSTKLPGRIARTALPGSAAVGTYEGVTSATEGNPLEQVAKDTLMGAAIGGVGDVAGRALLKGISKLARIPKNSRAEKEAFGAGVDIGEKLDNKPKQIPEYTTDTGSIRQRGATGQRPTLPMSQGEAAVRNQLNRPLLPGQVDNTIRPGGSTGQSGLPSVAGEKVMREYAEKAGLAWPPTDETMAVIRERFKNSPEIIKRWQSVYGKEMPSVKAPTLPTTELIAAKSILRQTKDLDRAAKILDTFPELKGEFKALTKKIANRKPITMIKPKIEPPKPPAELEAARSILKSAKNPDRIKKVFEVYPELKTEFPKIAKWAEKQAAKGLPKVAPVKSAAPPPAAAETGDKTFSGDATQLKDVGGWRSYMTDVYRNFKAVFGKDYEAVKKRILDPLDDSKKANVLHQEEWLGKLKSEVVDRLGIKKGSKESALVQQYGEKKITLEELKQLRPNDWQKIIEADMWFRKAYDSLIDEVNAVRRQIYPNAEKTMANIKAKIEATKANKKLTQTEKQEKVAELEAKFEEAMRGKFVPKRNDYYRHFNDMAEGFAGLKNIFDTPANIDPKLAGISDFTQPKGRFAGFMQRRGLGPYKNDAVGGFLNYIPTASYSIHIDPNISRFSKLADELSEATTDSRNINNFINFLRKYSQDLAGKTNPADRFIQELTSRKVFNGVNWLNNRVKANTVLANAGSALAQLANVPLGIAHSKQYAVPGVGKTLKSIFFDNKEIAKSGFIKERFGSYGSKMYRQFDVRLIDQPKKMAVWLMETADKMGTHFIWNSSYAKAVAEGAKNPVKYADEVTRSLVAGRGIGEVPLLQKSKLFQIVAPFQLEVANLWSVQRDFVKAKDFGALVTLYLGNYIFNRVMEETRGSGVVFDPIRAMVDAVTEEDISPLERGGRLAGEVLSNIPLGQTVAAAYPEYGMKIGDYQLPTRKKLFGRSDPTRFGSGVLAVKGLQEPLTKVLPPFGGSQLKKTAGGIAALKTNSVDDQKGNIKYPIAPDLANKTKGLLFGPGGFREAQDYYKNNRRPLSEKQTAELRASGNNPQKYSGLMLKREIESIDRKIADVNKDKKLGPEEKTKQLQALRSKKAALLRGGK